MGSERWGWGGGGGASWGGRVGGGGGGVRVDVNEELKFLGKFTKKKKTVFVKIKKKNSFFFLGGEG